MANWIAALKNNFVVYFEEGFLFKVLNIAYGQPLFY